MWNLIIYDHMPDMYCDYNDPIVQEKNLQGCSQHPK